MRLSFGATRGQGCIPEPFAMGRPLVDVDMEAEC
jgi:hypothetical protein